MNKRYKLSKMVLALVLMVMPCAVLAQNSNGGTEEEELTTPKRRNEVKVSLNAIFTSAPEITYERILREDMAVGTSLSFSFDKERYPFHFMITPYYRWFFTTTRAGASAFFIELNSALFSATYDASTKAQIGDGVEYKTEKHDKIGCGLGFSVGWKYVSRGNWVGEIHAGLGRNFVTPDMPIYPRGGIIIGYRF